MKLLDDFLPFHIVISRKSKLPIPWFTDSISELIVLQNKAKRIADRAGDHTEKCFFWRQDGLDCGDGLWQISYDMMILLSIGSSECQQYNHGINHCLCIEQ